MEFNAMTNGKLKSHLEKFIYYTDPQAYGTIEYHRLTHVHGLIGTDGVAELCKIKECFWVNDVIGSTIQNFSDSFGVALFIVNEDNSCDFLIHDGNYNLFIHKHIPFTDLKSNIKLFLCKDSNGWVLMLPSEY